MLSVSYLPFWRDPQLNKWLWPGEYLLITAIFWGGILVGIKRSFPRWSYPYVMVGIVSLAALVNLIVTNTPLHNFQLLWILAVAAACTVATFRWKPFRPFWSHIRKDWTYLSYGCFALIMLVSSGVDHDETPRLTIQVLLPSLLTLAGALIHLRAKSHKVRIMALVISFTSSLPIQISPLIDGMMGSPSSRAQVFSLLFGGYFILLAILLAPALISLIKRAKPGNETLK